jgi:hypothetical protein
MSTCFVSRVGVHFFPKMIGHEDEIRGDVTSQERNDDMGAPKKG